MVKWTVFTGLNRTMVENCGKIEIFDRTKPDYGGKLWYLWWCFRVDFAVVFLSCFCGGGRWWRCGGIFVVVFLWWCFCGGVFVVVFLWWCFRGGVFVVVWWCSESGREGFFKKSIVMKYCSAYYLEFC